jgi:hypothetical protein
LKSEIELQNLSQYEQYSTQGQQPNIMARSRAEDSSPIYAGEMRRGPSTLHYNPRDTQTSRDIGSDGIGGGPTGLMAGSASQLPPSTTTTSQVHPEPSIASRTQPHALTAVRQQETVRKTSSIMSLLNNDEPTEPRIPLIKRSSDGPSAPVQSFLPSATQQPLYPPARSLSGGQPGQMRRRVSIGDMQAPSHSYPRSAAPVQGPIRAGESPYSAVIQTPSHSRTQLASTGEAQPVADRDNYTYQKYGMQRPQQPVAHSAQIGGPYQAPQSSHHQMAFAPSIKRTSSPLGQYQPLQPPRTNSTGYRHFSPGPAGPPVTMAYGASLSTQHPTMRFPSPS